MALSSNVRAVTWPWRNLLGGLANLPEFQSRTSAVTSLSGRSPADTDVGAGGGSTPAPVGSFGRPPLIATMLTANAPHSAARANWDRDMTGPPREVCRPQCTARGSRRGTDRGRVVTF